MAPAPRLFFLRAEGKYAGKEKIMRIDFDLKSARDSLRFSRVLLFNLYYTLFPIQAQTRG